MLVRRCEEYLRFMHQAAEGFAVQNAVTVTLKFRAILAGVQRLCATFCVFG
jgi:hypothetical protein